MRLYFNLGTSDARCMVWVSCMLVFCLRFVGIAKVSAPPNDALMMHEARGICHSYGRVRCASLCKRVMARLRNSSVVEEGYAAVASSTHVA